MGSLFSCSNDSYTPPHDAYNFPGNSCTSRFDSPIWGTSTVKSSGNSGAHVTQRRIAQPRSKKPPAEKPDALVLHRAPSIQPDFLPPRKSIVPRVRFAPELAPLQEDDWGALADLAEYNPTGWDDEDNARPSQASHIRERQPPKPSQSSTVSQVGEWDSEDEEGESEEDSDDLVSRRLHTIFMIDVSASMKRKDVKTKDGNMTRSSATIENCVYLIDAQLAEHSVKDVQDPDAHDRYSLITFNDVSSLVFLREPPNIAKDRLLKYQHGLGGSEGTHYNVGFRELWNSFRDPSDHARVIFLSDGRPADWTQIALDEYVFQIYRNSRTKVYTVGLGNEDFIVLHQIASIGRGIFLECQLEQRCVRQVFTELSSTITASRQPRAQQQVPIGMPIALALQGGNQRAGRRARRVKFLLPGHKVDHKTAMRLDCTRYAYRFLGQTLRLTDFETNVSQTHILRTAKPWILGGMRLVFSMQDESETARGKVCRMLCKESKFVDQEPMDIFAKNHAVAEYYAAAFNTGMKTLGKGSPLISFTKCFLYDTGQTTCTGELYIEGNFTKWTGNNGYKNVSHCTEVPEAFMHFSFIRSGGVLMVTDVQGVLKKSVYCCTDPQLHSRDQEFGCGDHGHEGMTRFFRTHVCGEVCTHLGIAGKTMAHTQVIEAVLEDNFIYQDEHVDLPRLMLRAVNGALGHSSPQEQGPFRKRLDSVKSKLIGFSKANAIHEFGCLRRGTSGPGIETQVLLVALVPKSVDLADILESCYAHRIELPCQPADAKGFQIDPISTEAGALRIQLLLVEDTETHLAERKRDTKTVQRNARGAGAQRRERQSIKSMQEVAKHRGDEVRRFLDVCKAREQLVQDTLFSCGSVAEQSMLHSLILLAKYWAYAYHKSHGLVNPEAWFLELIVLKVWYSACHTHFVMACESFLHELSQGNGRLLDVVSGSEMTFDLLMGHGWSMCASESLTLLRRLPSELRDEWGKVKISRVPNLSEPRTDSQWTWGATCASSKSRASSTTASSFATAGSSASFSSFTDSINSEEERNAHSQSH